MELKDIVIKAQNGDSKAFTMLFEQTQRKVYFTALKILGNESVCEDIVQEVYMKAYTKLGTLKTPEAFIGWLCQITANTCKNYLVSNKPYVLGTTDDDEAIADLPELDEGFLPDAYADNRETCRIIMSIVDSLPEAQRAAVILYYYDEIPVSRIAELLQVSENTVKSRLNYARRQIKEQVEDLEKKGTKLHAVPVLGLILENAAEEYSLSSAASAAIIANVTSAGVAAGVAAGGGILAKIAALPIVTKVVAAAVAVAVSVGVGVGVASIANGEKKEAEQSEIVTVDNAMEKAYRELDVSAFIDAPLDEVVACFGDSYTKDGYESGEKFIEYNFDYGKERDLLIFMYENDANGNDIVTSIQLLSSVVNYMGININTTLKDAREILADNGYTLAHSNEGEYCGEIYNAEGTTFNVSILYQGDDIVNVSLDSYQSYSHGDGEAEKGYDAFITSGDYVIAVRDGEATVVDYIGYGVNIVVPSEIDGYKVIAIDTAWDNEKNQEYNGLGYSDFESVIIPEGVKVIGARSVKHCSNLKRIELPDTLSEIGYDAFVGCRKLESITIPSGVKEINDSTFWECKTLSEVNLPNTIERIGGGAFNNCAFESIVIPKSVKVIEGGAFAECSDLKSITLPSGITEIANELFSECDSLETVEILGEVTRIGDGAFYECYALESLKLPAKLKEIGDGAFGKCENLKNITLPEGLTHIGGSAFAYCENLEELTIPSSVTSIGAYSPFAACYELTLNLDGGKHFVIDDSGVLFNKDKTEIIYVPADIEEYTVPGSVEKICAGAFAECDEIESIIIPKGVKEIGEGTFLWCDALESIEVPASVNVIGEQAFESYGVVIRCHENSYAAEYATENDIDFELID